MPEKSQTGSHNSKRSVPRGLDRPDSSQWSEGREKESIERTSSFENRRQSSFMLAVTRQKNKDIDEAIYAVPHNNSQIMNSQKDISQFEARHGYVKQNSVGYLADIPDGPEDPDGYNYTLSNSDQYRRPGMNGADPNRLPLTPNFSRTNEQQRKESFKKGKGKVAADVIRYHVDGSRRSSQSSESDIGSPVHEPTIPVSNNKPALPAKPKLAQTRSNSVDDNLSTMADGTNSSHKVIKPLPTSPPLDSVTRAHTPVQSGLATLPRSKKSGNNISSSNMNSCVPSPSSSSSSLSSSMTHTQPRPGSQHMAANPHQQYPHDAPPPPYNVHTNHPASTGYQNCLTYQNVVENDAHSRQSSSSSILSSGTVVECPIPETDSHNRQMSTTSQDTLTDKPKEQKTKSKKKDKDEKRKDENKQRKEEKKLKNKKDKSSKASNSDKPPLPDKKQGDEGFSEETFYIDRRMVESVLSAQKLQRSGSCVSQASTSSIESDTTNRGLGLNLKDNLSTEIPFDAASLDSHKDSGYTSSDRNSSSSTGSITMNPYDQYFLSRSMIPPKTINHQAMAENMRKLMDDGPGMNGLEYTQEKDLKSLVMNPNEHCNKNLTVGYCQQTAHYTKSGMQLPHSDVTALSKPDRDQQLFNVLSGKNKTCLAPQVPSKFPQGPQQLGQGPYMPRNGPTQTVNGNNDKGMFIVIILLG